MLSKIIENRENYICNDGFVFNYFSKFEITRCLSNKKNQKNTTNYLLISIFCVSKEWVFILN